MGTAPPALHSCPKRGVIQMNTGHQLLNLQESDFVRLAGDAPANGEWHVNDHIVFTTTDDPEGMLKRVVAGGSPGDGSRHGYVLQRADATAEWLALVVDETQQGGDLTTVAHFDDVGGVPAELDVAFDVDAIAATLGKLHEK